MKSLFLAAAAGLMAVSGPLPTLAQPRAVRPTIAPPGAPVSFADIVERVAPAVVSIEAKRPAPRQPTIQGLPPGFPFDLLPQQPGPQQGPPPEATAAGSGFFISADGYIVTNAHVVEDATEITVTLKDERELTATVVGRDENTDLAVLKVEGRNFPFVSFANAATPRVGDWVVAIGNPFGLGGTATAGIVSAYGREIGSTWNDFIQIDAPINRGNSGGPTFDAFGRVIGVNTIIVSSTGGSVGIGFAIPAAVADRVTKDLIENGEIRRGYIGAGIRTVDEEIAESQGREGLKGVLISEITAGGPAEQAGLQVGDIVTQVNGQRVDTQAQFIRQVGGTRPGETVRLTLLRDGAERTLTIRSGLRPSEEALNTRPGGTPPRPVPESGTPSQLGLSVRPIDEALRRQYSIDGAVRGVVIDQVAPGSDAQTKGLRPGDVVARVNDRAVTTPAELDAAVAAAKAAGRENVLVYVIREGRQLALPLKIAEPAAAEE